MPVFQAIVLGVIQGLTEFLPISSSGHLVLVPWLLGWPYHGLTFDVALHLGTLLSLVAYFWRDWLTYLRALWLSIRHQTLDIPDAKIAWILGAASVPAALVGVVGNGWLEHSARQPAIIGIMLIAAAIVLLLADRFGRRVLDLKDIGWQRGMIIGLAQALALIPGVSRSGSTITAGLLLGLNRVAAARFAFLLAVPITVGAVLYEGVDVFRTGLSADERLAFAAGIAASALTGFMAIKWMLGFVQHRSMMVFVVYRLIIGIAVLIGSILL